MAHDVFISYASSDKAVADAVCSQLESIHRIRCWIAPRDVTPGASWAESIIDALDGSKIMVLIFSSNANASMQIEREVERAVHKGINIIPLRIENAMPTKTLEYFISAPHWLDALSRPLEDHINKLAQSVKALLSKQGVHPAQAATKTPAPAYAVATGAPAPAAKSWTGPALIAASIVTVAAIFGARWNASSEPAATNQPAQVSQTAAATAKPVAPAAATTAPVASPVQTAAPSQPPAPVTPAPAENSAAAAAVVASREPNMFIDFRNTLPSGSMTLEIDGQTKWTTKLGAGIKPGGKDFEDLRTALNLEPGAHKVTATLRTPDGKVRDADSTSVTVPPGGPRTLRVRLSRFRHHVEFQSVAGKPEPPAKAPAATQKPAAAAKPNQAASKPASTASKPTPIAAAGTKPATTKPAATVNPVTSKAAADKAPVTAK